MSHCGTYLTTPDYPQQPERLSAKQLPQDAK